MQQKNKLTVKPISSYKKKINSTSIDIIGLAPSINFYNNNSNNDKVSLNQSWKFIKCDYLITIHPEEALTNYNNYVNLPKIIFVGYEKWIRFVDKLDDKENIELHEALMKREIYYFKYRLQKENFLRFDPSNAGRNLMLINFRGNYLYVWSSISQTAMHLSYYLGYKFINLVGCESISFKYSDNITGKDRWNGVPKEYRMNQYIQGNMDIAHELRKRGIVINTLTPFVGLNLFEKQLEKLNEIEDLTVAMETNKASLHNVSASVLFLISKLIGKSRLLRIIKKIAPIIKKINYLIVIIYMYLKYYKYFNINPINLKEVKFYKQASFKDYNQYTESSIKLNLDIFKIKFEFNRINNIDEKKWIKKIKIITKGKSRGLWLTLIQKK